MTIQWNRLLGKTLVWLAAEIMLNLLGFDNLADYSEFIFQQDEIVELPMPALSQSRQLPINSSSVNL